MSNTQQVHWNFYGSKPWLTEYDNDELGRRIGEINQHRKNIDLYDNIPRSSIASSPTEYLNIKAHIAKLNRHNRYSIKTPNGYDGGTRKTKKTKYRKRNHRMVKTKSKSKSKTKRRHKK